MLKVKATSPLFTLELHPSPVNVCRSLLKKGVMEDSVPSDLRVVMHHNNQHQDFQRDEGYHEGNHQHPGADQNKEQISQLSNFNHDYQTLQNEHNDSAPVKQRRRKSGPPLRPNCPECNKSFSNQSALSKHKLTHSDVRKFSCHLCGKAFKRQDHLNGHMLTHREKKPYECDVEGCEKTYCDARSLRRHKENHHTTLSLTGNPSLASSALRSLLSQQASAGHVSHPHRSSSSFNPPPGVVPSSSGVGLMDPHQPVASRGILESVVGSLNTCDPRIPNPNGHMSLDVHQHLSRNLSLHHPQEPHQSSSVGVISSHMSSGYNHSQQFVKIHHHEMRSPAPPPLPSRHRHLSQQQQPPPHPLPPPSVSLPSDGHFSHSVPNTPTTHPQTPADPIPSPHHLSVNSSCHYGSSNGVVNHSLPCTPTQPVNTFSFSPHQVQQYHQQQLEDHHGPHSLPSTPTDQNSPPEHFQVPQASQNHMTGSSYTNGPLHNTNPHHNHHAPRSLPATPAENLSLNYPNGHTTSSYNDPNPSPYSVASQSSPYDLHAPPPHIQQQQIQPQPHTGVDYHQRERHDVYPHQNQIDSYIPDENTDSQGLDDDAAGTLRLEDLQNFVEEFAKEHHQELQQHSSPAVTQPLPPVPSNNNSYFQTEPITPVSPMSACADRNSTHFNSFPIPDKNQAHVYHQQQVHHHPEPQIPTLPVVNTYHHQQPQQHHPPAVRSENYYTGKGIANHVPNHHLNHNQQHVFHAPHHVDVVSTRTLTVPNSPQLYPQNLSGKNHSFQSSLSDARNLTDQNSTQSLISSNQNQGCLRRGSSPPPLVVNLSPSQSAHSTITIDDEEPSFGQKDLMPKPHGTPVILEEVEDGMEDEVFATPTHNSSSFLKRNSIVPSDPQSLHPKSNDEKQSTSSDSSQENQVIMTEDEVPPVPHLNPEKSEPISGTGSQGTGGVIVHHHQPNGQQQNGNNANFLYRALVNGGSEGPVPVRTEKIGSGGGNRGEAGISPKRMKHKPKPIYIPPHVNACGAVHHIQSRLSRSPRLWDGAGNRSSAAHVMMLMGDHRMAPALLDSRLHSPPPYTPPPMLSPVRTSSGFYYHIINGANLTPKSISSGGANSFFSRKSCPPLLSQMSIPHVMDMKDAEILDTPKTAYEPEFETVIPETDMQPHVNVGPQFQAKIPAFIGDKKPDPKNRYKGERADLIFDPQILESIPQEDLDNFLEGACSACIIGSGRNKEYAYHILNKNKGNIIESIICLLEPDPKIAPDDPLFGYHYPEPDVWSTLEITAYHQALIKCDKNFFAISKQMKTKSVKQCIEFYYLWKKVCADEYRKLRVIRRRKEQSLYAPEAERQKHDVEEDEESHSILNGGDDDSRSQTPSGLNSCYPESGDEGSTTGFESGNPSPAPSSVGSVGVNNNNHGEYPCKICGKVFNKIKSRSAHMKIHGSQLSSKH